MAGPTYTHDLIDWIADSDTTAWGELTGMSDATAPDEADTESALQGTNTVSQQTNISGAQLFSQGRVMASPVTLSTGQVFLVWHGHGVATALETYANGGLRLAVIGSSLANWKAWAVGGKDTPPFPYAKWVNNPIDPSPTGEYTGGTPPTGMTNIYGVGSGGRQTAAVAKGQPHVTDMIRYGRAEARFTGGDSGTGYATFAGFAALNDATTARWGLIQVTDGGYLWKGLMVLGDVVKTTSNRARSAANVATLTTSTAHGLRVGDTVVITGVGGIGYNATAVITVVGSTTTFSYANTGSSETTTADTGGSINPVVDFRNSNKNIFIQDTRKVYAAFNKIEISNASSRVDWTGINFICLSPSTTASKGDFEVIDNADVNISGCTFTDMNTFIFQSNSTIDDTTFRRCALITAGSASFNGCLITNSTSTVSVSATALSLFTDCTFVSDGGNHAIDLGTIAASTSMNWNNYLTNYATSDGSSGNEAIKVSVASGQTLTINVGTGYATPSVYKTGSGSVSVVSGQVTTGVTVKDLNTGNAIVTAIVLLWVANGTNKPFEATVTIAGTGTTATVTHSSHGLITGDKIIITGVTNDDVYNGVFSITYGSSSTYTYTTAASITAATASGASIKATFAVISGTTDTNGYIEDIRSWSSNQDVIGWARKSTTNPYYQQGALSGEIDTGAGLSLTVQLVRDE